MSFDETKPISAGDILKDPDQIMGLMQQYILLREMSMFQSYKSLLAAVNLMAEYGWEAISMSGGESGTMFVLMRNTHYKRKND